jgi:phage recombination protein Bet
MLETQVVEPQAVTPAPAPQQAPSALVLHEQRLTRDQIELLKTTICKGATDDELKLFIHVCEKTGLNPFVKQIHAVKRYDNYLDREVMSIQTAIDGFRLIAHRTNEMNGTEGPYWCGPDAKWSDVWLSSEPPAASKFIVFRKGHDKPYTGIARYDAYVQTKRDGQPNHFWNRMPDHMIAKVAEALALRKGFPQELGGIYTDEEMANAASKKTAAAAAKAEQAEADTPRDAALKVLQQQLLRLVRKTSGAKNEKEARARLKDLAGVGHEGELDEERTRALGRALEAVAAGRAELSKNEVIERDTRVVLWAEKPSAQAKKVAEAERPADPEPPTKEAQPAKKVLF